MEKVSDTIKRLSLAHINNGNKLLGQCLTAVGWVGGTVPELPNHENIIELSMADVAGGGIAVGASLFGNRPIYVVRYQGFLWYNLISVVNYAAKSKFLWGVECPLIVRAIAMEGKIGPVAGSSHCSLAYRMPGIRIVSPMTPREYEKCWEELLQCSDPTIISEHRKSYSVNYETPIIKPKNPVINLFTISATRFEAMKAIEKSKLTIGFYPIVNIKPLTHLDELVQLTNNAEYGSLILDDDYVDGIAKSIAYDIMIRTNKPVHVLGLKNETSGFSDETDNLPPDATEILKAIHTITKIAPCSS